VCAEIIFVTKHVFFIYCHAGLTTAFVLAAATRSKYKTAIILWYVKTGALVTWVLLHRLSQLCVNAGLIFQIALLMPFKD